jgi:hypothetical protein
MSAVKSSSSQVPGNGRLTERQAAAELGLNLGQLGQIRYGGPKYHDPSLVRPCR